MNLKESAWCAGFCHQTTLLLAVGGQSSTQSSEKLLKRSLGQCDPLWSQENFDEHQDQNHHVLVLVFFVS